MYIRQMIKRGWDVGRPIKGKAYGYTSPKAKAKGKGKGKAKARASIFMKPAPGLDLVLDLVLV